MVQLAALAFLGALPAMAQTSETTARPEPPKTATVSAPAKTRSRAALRHKAKPDPLIAIPPAQTIPRFTPEQLPPQPPQVSFQDGRLAVSSQNSTFGDVMSAIRRLTGVRFESVSGAVVENFPTPNERVAAVLTGSPREVIGALLDGLNLGYILVSAPGHPDGVKTVVLTSSPQSQRSTQASSAGPGVPVPVRPQPMPRRPEPPPEEEAPPPVETTQPEQMQLPPPAAPGQMPPGLMPGQNPAPPQIQPQGSNIEPPQSQPRTPAELLQMMQQRNQNRGAGDPAAPPAPQP